MYFTYVLFSKTLNKRYVRSAANFEKRLKEHNTGKSRFTKGGIPWTLVYQESFKTNSETRKRELFLKSGVDRKLLDQILDESLKGSAP